jgi:hypothetical protein
MQIFTIKLLACYNCIHFYRVLAPVEKCVENTSHEYNPTSELIYVDVTDENTWSFRQPKWLHLRSGEQSESW